MSGREHPLRAEAQRVLGSKARQDRGGALYSAPQEGERPTSELFAVGLKDGRARLKPTRKALALFEEWADGQLKERSALGAELEQMRGRAVSEAELELFAQGVKQFELNTAPMMWLVYDKRLRQLAAEGLRAGGGGGGLYACWLCMMLSLGRIG